MKSGRNSAGWGSRSSIRKTITCRGKVVGSGDFGHTVGKTIAMGYLSTEDSQTADGYAVEVFGESFPAKRLAKAPYDPERRRIFL
jgi:dimethylglycine dehydrogenase